MSGEPCAESRAPNSSWLAPSAKEDRSGDPVMERLANGKLGEGSGAGEARVEVGRDRGSEANGETGEGRAVLGAEEEPESENTVRVGDMTCSMPSPSVLRRR